MRVVFSLQLFNAWMLIFTSPQLPTPRRSLFSQNLFGTISGRGKSLDLEVLGQENFTYGGIEQVTTPPLPSSSPGPGNDSMEISPLPHKAPFIATQIVASPTREAAHIDDLISSLPKVSPPPLTEVSRQPALFE